MRKNKLLLLLALLMTAATGAMAQDYYAPSTDEVIILNDVYDDSKNGYSSHSAIAWEGTASDYSKKAGDPNNGGQPTSSTVSCYSVKGTGQGKNITLSITGVSKVIVYHERNSSRYIELRDGSKTGNIIGSGQTNTYYTEVELTATNEYSIFLHGTRDDSDQDFYVYAIKLIAAPAAPAAAGYTVSLKDGVKDADKWTVKVGEGQAQALPIGGLKGDGSETVTLQYNGRLKVKGVKATSEAAAPSVPEGAINGKFSVSDGKQVYFSKGNLRYASSKWSFFDNQYDYYTSYSADAWDHFGWSTSTTDYGMNTSTSNSDYSGDFVDWGATMGTGWFTLTSAEWTYLFNNRSASSVNGTENGRYAKAKVNGVQGVILFPDTYTHPDGVNAPTGVNATDDTGWNGNSYTVADWTKMESAGCVFLPAAGMRLGTSMSGLGSNAYYWSATPNGPGNVYDVYISSYSLATANFGSRIQGLSVRLVQEATSEAEQSAKPAATVTTAPKGAEIVGVGKTTELVSGGVAEGGTLMYAVTTTNTKPTSTDGFSDAVPTAQTITASGKVYVWYYVKGDDTHSDSEIAATAIEVPVADIVWDATNVSGLEIWGTEDYEVDGVKLRGNAENISAGWVDYGDPATLGIVFEPYESGGYTFTAPSGKAFKKIVMNAQSPAGWYEVNLGDGWTFVEDGDNEIFTVTWKDSAASSVELLPDTDDFSGAAPVKSIAFYLSE